MKTKIINAETIVTQSNALLLENPILYMKLEKVTANEVTPHELLSEVLKFMYLVSVSKMRLTPSKIVDDGWHEFILFTRVYHEFCNTKLGRFIHHTPDDNKTRNNRNYLKTIQHYIRLFGKPPVHIWGEVSNTEWIASQCGSCSSN